MYRGHIIKLNMHKFKIVIKFSIENYDTAYEIQLQINCISFNTKRLPTK